MAPPGTPAMPITPAAQKVQQPTPTGRWKHPKFDEITRRQQSTTFDERNVQAIVVNGAVLIFSFAAFNVVPNVALLRVLQAYLISIMSSIPFADYLLWAIRLVFLANIVQAFLPLARRYSPDEIADIPLTPSQRATMGLDPNVSTPQTPGSAYASPNYITPPRYQRSTPRNSFGTPVERQSPLSLSGSPSRAVDSMGKSTSNSPFSPNTGSPLFRGAVSGSASKRLSFDGRGSPLANSSLFTESSSSNAPSTPTPSNGKASVGLNNKWLYEKRRDSPRSSLFA